MTKHILLAVDLTHEKDTRALLAEAGRIADLEEATLSVVTVLPDYGSSFVGSFFKDGTLKEASAKAIETLHRLAEEVLPDREQVQCIVEVGTAYEKVLHAAETIDATLILVGAHKPNFAGRIIGPNAARVVRHASVSVLVLRL